MRRFMSVAVLALAVCLAAAGPASASPAAIGNGNGLEGVPGFDHVFVIIGENTDLSALNKHNAPYLLGTIKPESAWLTHYYAITHYSESNYVAMTSGTFTACEQADGSVASCHNNDPNLFQQLDQQFGSYQGAWTSWMESMPSPCFNASAGGDPTLNHYAPKHNPALIFDNVSGGYDVNGNQTPSAECNANDIAAGTTGPNDMSAFNSALSSGQGLSRFNLVVPNECEDAHDNCKPAGNPVLQFDSFLRQEVHAITTSPAWGPNDAIVVTFDEGTTKSPNHADKFGNGGNVAFAVISPLAVPGVYPTVYDHYSLLRTLEDGFGIGTHVGNAAQANAINVIWG